MEVKSSKVTIVSKAGCKFCDYAKSFLQERCIPYEEEVLTPGEPEYAKRRTVLIKSTNQATFPWIFIGSNFIGGYKELLHAANTFRLHQLLEEIGIQYVDDGDF